MVRGFLGDQSNASFYAGILISSFALSEALTGMFWGSLSDRVGRKPVLLLGCAGTMLSMLLMGFATNFWMALFGRALGGLLNGNIGVIQTVVGELVRDQPQYEPRAFAVMPFVWSIGTILGPCAGGFLSNPHETYPALFSESGIFAQFPYLLPNLVCAALLLMSIIVGLFMLEETHPDLQPWSTKADFENSVADTPLMATVGSIANAGADLRAESYGTFNRVDIQESETWVVNADGSLQPSAMPLSSESIMTRQIVMLVAALGIFTYHTMAYDHLLPIFLEDKQVSDVSALRGNIHDMSGGLGMTTQQVGMIMAVNGVIALFIQAVVFPLFAEWLGVWKLFLAVTILHPIAYFIVPFIALLPTNLIYPGIYVALTMRNFPYILAYPLILILIKEACPKPSVLGKINGLAASAGAACRTLAPPVAGLLYGLGGQIGFTGIAWWGSGLVAVVGAFQLFYIKRDRSKKSTVRVPCAAPVETGLEDKDVIRIIVSEV
ncbi:hypothetical protein MMC26_004968 [Xylographa opegraphella]|nr:hypothetical protein [Xylographa opegraphella]